MKIGTRHYNQLTMNLISKKIVDGYTVAIYRHTKIAGMRFMYKKCKTDKIKMNAIGHYDYQIVTNLLGETVSEKKLSTKMYDE